VCDVASSRAWTARAHHDTSVGQLIAGARCGDQACWDALVERFASLIWTVARGFRMSPADSADISQTTWLRLAEHLERLQEPDRVGAWLVTTTRRECLRRRRIQNRHVLVGDKPEPAARVPDVDIRVLVDERDTALWRCIGQLPERSRALIAMLVADPPIAYADIADALDMPVGSIGPTRARLLTTLRRQVEAAGITPAD
jgi:RNA polymerase sigma factor (sigma-70 family)